MKKITTSEREIQVKARCKHLGHNFLGWLSGHQNKDSKLVIECPEHGSWSPMLSNYVRNGRCSKCVIESRRLNLKDVESRISKSLNSNQTLIGPIGKYINNNTKFKVECKYHGGWSASSLHLIHSNSGCPKCGNDLVRLKRRHSINDLKLMINDKLSDSDKYRFIGFDGIYKNSKSKIILSCKDHGEWSLDIATVLAGRHGCSSCSKAGFKPNLEASLYVLKSLCGNYFKVGISNNANRRLIELKRSTPFGFVEIHRFNDAGTCISRLEKALHSEFESASMKGFNGATEWFLWSDVIMDRIKQL